MKLFTWLEGRQQGTEYRKFCFLYFKLLRYGCDGYILKYEPHTTLPPHRDELQGKHYRLNIELYGKGLFTCEKVIFNLFNKVYLFRPDLNTHSVINFDSRRYVLSLGFAVLSSQPRK